MTDNITLTVSIELYEYLHRHVDIQMRHYRLMARERPNKAHLYEPRHQLFNQGLTDFEKAYYERNQKIHSLRKDWKPAKPFCNSNEVEREQLTQARGVLRPLPSNMELVQRVGQKGKDTGCQLHQAPSPGHQACTGQCNGFQTVKGLTGQLLLQLTHEKAKNKHLEQQLAFFEHLTHDIDKMLQLRPKIAKRA